MTTASQAYKELEAHNAHTFQLQAADVLLSWDRNVVMPPKAAGTHGEIAAAMTQTILDRVTSPRVGELLELAADADLDPWQRANVEETRRLYLHATAAPTELEVRKSLAAATMNQAWRQAKAEQDYSLYAPHFKEMMAIIREVAACKSEALGMTPYDALMDEMDPGISCEIVDSVFDQLAAELPELLNEVLERQSSWTVLPLDDHHPAALQKQLSEWCMQTCNYPMDHGRVDVTPHPFALAYVPNDQRITTHYKEDDPRFAVMGTIHETGHSMFEYHLPKDWRRWQPVGRARGATLHESQSIMLEMMASRSHEFLKYLAPQIRSLFGKDSAAYSDDNIRYQFQRVERNFIRIEASEVVYPLHVILRYRIERALLDGSLEVDDLPDAWNAMMQELIGVTPPNVALGCIQDVHWSFGMFGYFPNYAMGEATAAQLFEAANAANPEILPEIGRGNFTPYFDWVRPNVHEKASSQSIMQIIEGASGKPLTADSLLAHLRRRYLDRA